MVFGRETRPAGHDGRLAPGHKRDAIEAQVRQFGHALANVHVLRPRPEQAQLDGSAGPLHAPERERQASLFPEPARYHEAMNAEV